MSKKIYELVLNDNYGGFENVTGVGLKTGTWDGIVSSSLAIDDMGLAFSDSFIKKVSNGDLTLFWEDSWIAPGPCFRLRFLRLYTLESNKEANVKDRWMISNRSAAVDRVVATFPNLAKRGIMLASIICLLCKMEEEFVPHQIITCSFSNSIWKKLGNWQKYHFLRFLTLKQSRVNQFSQEVEIVVSRKPSMGLFHSCLVNMEMEKLLCSCLGGSKTKRSR
ncbi:hypothetical protein Tco_0660303 [Tanacetum coccineum]